MSIAEPCLAMSLSSSTMHLPTSRQLVGPLLDPHGPASKGREGAAEAKAAGNEAFRQGDNGRAVQCYTKVSVTRCRSEAGRENSTGMKEHTGYTG